MMKKMKAVFLDRATVDNSLDFSMLESLVDLTCFPTSRSSQVVERMQSSEIAITNKVIFDADIITQLPELKLICITATGTNNVDLNAARQAGVAVTNVTGYSTMSVAQHVFAYLLNVTNGVTSYLSNNQIKPWNESATFCQFDAPINELDSKTLGIFGYGNLGKAVANIGRVFGMRVLVSERPNVSKLRNNRVTFETMLTESDVISVHCPLNEETENLFNIECFNRMKKGCIFINTARGPVVNSQDLAHALKIGHIGHAIVDVLEQEPPQASHTLLQADIPNLSLSPHIAWGSLQAQERLFAGVTQNIQAFQAGNKLNRVE